MPTNPYDGLPTEATAPPELTQPGLEDRDLLLLSEPLEPDAPERQAARAMRDRAVLEAEITRLVRLHLEATTVLNEWLARETVDLKEKLDQVNSQISVWHRRAHADKRAGLEVKFPYGSSKLGPEPRASLDITDEPALVEWCEANVPEAVVVTKKVSKTALKAKVAPPKGDTAPVMAAFEPETGERVPGAQFLIPARTWKVTR